MKSRSKLLGKVLCDLTNEQNLNRLDFSQELFKQIGVVKNDYHYYSTSDELITAFLPLLNAKEDLFFWDKKIWLISDQKPLKTAFTMYIATGCMIITHRLLSNKPLAANEYLYPR